MAYRSSSIATGTSGSLTGTAPAGLTDDDWMLALVVIDGTKTVSTVPTGWDLIATISNTGPDVQSAWVYEKVAASEGASWLWETSAAGSWIVIVSAHSGRNTSGSLIVQGTTNNSDNASPISVALTGVTALSNDDVAWFAQLDQVGGTDTWGFAPPTDYTERQDGAATEWIRASLATRDNVSAGATGTLTGTATRTSGSSGSGFSGVVVALPVAGGGGGDPEGSLAGGKLISGGLLLKGVLVP